MDTKKAVILTVIIASVLVLFFWLKGCTEVDKCLDSGGRWNDEKNICEGARINN